MMRRNDFSKKEKDRKFYIEHKEEVIKRNNEYRRVHYAERLFNACKKRAKIRGIEFNIEISDIIIPEYCPYLGLPITNSVGEGKKNTLLNASIDRIDNTKGYIKGNIEVISTKANIMKHDVSPEQLLIFAKNIIKRSEEYDNEKV